MYSEYTTRFIHSIQFMCILYNLYCIVHIDYTDIQLYFHIILHYIYRMCVKINALYAQCTVYTVHIAYICALRNTPLYLPSQEQRILRALVK